MTAAVKISSLYRRFGTTKKRRVVRALSLLLITVFVSHSVVEQLWRPVAQPEYGVSFSADYARELGVDWRANFTALLDDLAIKNYRLMSYWDRIEPSAGRYVFDELDWQMDAVATRGGSVSLAIGLRQPRWPECRQPDWAAQLGENSGLWTAALNRYITAVVERYRDHPALKSYQLENEAKNKWFGSCKGAAPSDRLQQEFELVKRLDDTHPVTMSLSDQHGLPLGQPIPDAYGFSVYRKVWNTQVPGLGFYLYYPTPLWYHRARKVLIERVKDRPIFIHELQAEPWCPVATKDCSIDEQNRSMSVEQLRANIDFARKIGAARIDLWGGEWWYWRKVHFGDASVWEAVRSELQS